MSDETLAGFFGLDDEEKARASAKALAKSPEIARARAIPAPFRGAAADAVIWAARNLLNSPIANVFADAWSTAREFDKARSAPSGEVVEMALREHDISLTRQPSIEIMLNGAPTGVKLPFEFKLGVTISSALLKFRDATIIGCDLGKVKGGGSVSFTNITVARRETSTVRLPGKLTFDPGVRLR